MYDLLFYYVISGIVATLILWSDVNNPSNQEAVKKKLEEASKDIKVSRKKMWFIIYLVCFLTGFILIPLEIFSKIRGLLWKKDA